jgi:prophage DNA circulation protein
MSWRDQLRPGSFRGAPFRIQGNDGEGGRRGALHEFPERDEPWFEDLGRAARRWTIEAIVIGENYLADLDALVAACEEKGPGTLVHPYRGTLWAEHRRALRELPALVEAAIAQGQEPSAVPYPAAPG